jgi:hypothetical protein
MRITNITELVWSHESEALLRMCGEEERLIGCDASDYERFFALCRSASLLRGNRLAHRIACFISSLVRHPVELCAENAEILWRESSEALLATSVERSLRESFAPEQSEAENLDICPRQAYSDFFDGNCLLNTSQDSWEAWCDEMKVYCEKAFEQGFFGIFLTILMPASRIRTPTPTLMP